MTVVISDPEDAKDEWKARKNAKVDVDMNRRWVSIYKITLNAHDKFTFG